MFSRTRRPGLIAGFVSCLALLATNLHAASVWKVTSPSGGTLYLGGSVHSLRSTDYPLPAAFNRAFEASTRLALEVDEKGLSGSSADIVKAGRYPKGDSLKNHVDPRTYDYLRRLFALMKEPEAKFSQFRPWFIVLMLQSPGQHGFSHSLGVDQYLMRRARANKKLVTGLESVREHAEVFSGLTDKQGEALLLISLIPRSTGDLGAMEAWRRGDADGVARILQSSYADFPSFSRRLLDERNRRWLPKIESYLQSRQTYFVVVGGAHLGGPAGVLSLLRERGHQITQL